MVKGLLVKTTTQFDYKTQSNLDGTEWLASAYSHKCCSGSGEEEKTHHWSHLVIDHVCYNVSYLGKMCPLV